MGIVLVGVSVLLGSIFSGDSGLGISFGNGREVAGAAVLIGELMVTDINRFLFIKIIASANKDKRMIIKKIFLPGWFFRWTLVTGGSLVGFGVECSFFSTFFRASNIILILNRIF